VVENGPGIVFGCLKGCVDEFIALGGGGFSGGSRDLRRKGLSDIKNNEGRGKSWVYKK
jgi:hypothetical protein